MLAAAVAMVLVALGVQGLDTSSGQARYWQHEHQPSEDELDPAESATSATSGEELCTHLPIVRVETGGQKIPGKTITSASGLKLGYETGDNGESEISVSFSTVEDEGVWHHASDKANVSGTALFRIRGNSSRRFSKTGYRLSITKSADAASAEGKQALLGMAEGTKWSLHGPFLDKTLMRNYLCLNLCGEVMDQWVPEVRFCELIIDGKYQGLYMLIEMIEVQENRVNIRKCKDGDATCSYLMRMERDEGSPKNLETFDSYTFRLEPNHVVELLYPGPAHQSEEMRNYASANISAIERMFQGGDVDGWTSQIDMKSFVDYYLLEEFMAINDAFSGSTYYYRDVRGRLTMGPAWDFNNSFNNFFNDLPTREFILSQRGWFAALMRSEDFVERVISRWHELRSGVLSDGNLRDKVYSTRSWLGSAIDRNFEVWGYSFDTSKLKKDEMRLPYENSNQTVADLNPANYDEAMEWLVDYMLNRARWMDENIHTLRQYCHESRNQ
ncbi:MAG: CotH kinase family protein [Coriobacteriales bacterium]|nr:CotH kinase family protein [Coriobacteriales bacterium]